MAVEILTYQTIHRAEGSSSLAELSVLYGEKAVAEAQTRLQIVLDFKAIKPKSVLVNDRRVPTSAIEELAQKAAVSLGTLWRWYRLYRSAYNSTHGNVHLKAKAGFEALVPRNRGKSHDSSEDRRYKINEELRRAIAGLYARRKRPSITKVWRKLIANCPQCRE